MSQRFHVGAEEHLGEHRNAIDDGRDRRAVVEHSAPFALLPHAHADLDRCAREAELLAPCPSLTPLSYPRIAATAASSSRSGAPALRGARVSHAHCAAATAARALTSTSPLTLIPTGMRRRQMPLATIRDT